MWSFKISSEQKSNIDQTLDYWGAGAGGWDSFACTQRLYRLFFVVARERMVAVLGCGEVTLSVRQPMRGKQEANNLF